MPGGKVADVQRDPGELPDLGLLSLREEPIGDSALIEDLDRARVQTTCARAGEVLAGAPLDDCDVHARQRQLARQHQPCRTASGDHHRVPLRGRSSLYAEAQVGYPRRVDHADQFELGLSRQVFEQRPSTAQEHVDQADLKLVQHARVKT